MERDLRITLLWFLQVLRDVKWYILIGVYRFSDGKIKVLFCYLSSAYLTM
jgi:hypothetical protein